jgi:outer membrane protein assembly factor BamB
VAAAPDDPNSLGPQTSFAIGTDGTLYAYNGDLTALHPDGSIAWTTPVTSYPTTADGFTLGLTVGSDGTIYVADAPPEGAGHVFALGVGGQTIWQATLGGGLSPFRSPSLGVSGTIFLVAVDSSGSRSLVALTPAGDTEWVAPAGTADLSRNVSIIVDDSPAVASDGNVYASCGDDGEDAGASAFCVFSPDGALVATYPTSSRVWALTPVPAAGRVYASTDSGLEAFGTDGTLLWTLGQLGPAPPIVDGQGTLFVPLGPGTGAVGRNGQVLWYWNLPAPVAMGADGTVYGVDMPYGEREPSLLLLGALAP